MNGINRVVKLPKSRGVRMKYFAISFIVGVFLFMYVVFPIMDALEIHGIAELHEILISPQNIWLIFAIALFAFILFLLVYISLKKNKYV